MSGSRGGARRIICCPYCWKKGICEHLLLFFDRNRRIVDGGVLGDALRVRLYLIQQRDASDFDLNKEFDDIIEEISAYADYSDDFIYVDGYGHSYEYSVFYVKSDDEAKEALEDFREAFE